MSTSRPRGPVRPVAAVSSRSSADPAPDAVRSDLFQHRLWLPSPPTDSAPHEWTDVLIPFDDFTLTNSGDLSATQLEMLRTGVRTVGISVLGPAEGRYELGVEAIDAVSVEPGELERWREKLPPQKGADGGPL